MNISELKIGSYLVEYYSDGVGEFGQTSDIYKLISISNDGMQFERESDNAVFEHSYKELDEIFRMSNASYYIAHSDLELLPYKLKLDL